MRYLFLIAFIFLFNEIEGQTFFHGTCVIGKISGNSIIIGADSRRSEQTYDKGNSKDYSVKEACKIHGANGFYYASAGSAPQSTHEMVMKSCKSSKNAIELYNKLQTDVMNDLHISYLSLKNNKSDQYRKYENQYCFQIMVAFFENKKPVLVKFGYLLLPNTDAQFEMRDAEMDSLVIGSYASIWKDFTSSSTWKKSDAITISDLIKKVEKAEPNNVGGPIDIIQIWENRYKWISKKKYCALDSGDK